MKLNAQHIIFMGDPHSYNNYKHITRFINKYNLTNSLFVLLGDCGVGFNTEKKEKANIKYWNEALSSKNNTIVAIRGNHDNPKYFNNEYSLSHFKLITDYTVIEIENLNIRLLGIGGAISIDRYPNRFIIDPQTKKEYKGRKLGLDYWSEEQVYYNHIVEELTNIDIVFSHSAPNMVYPYTKSGIKEWLGTDHNLENDVNTERNILTKVYDNLKIKNNITHWLYGHFHMSNISYVDDTKFVLVDKEKFYELRI